MDHLADDILDFTRRLVAEPSILVNEASAMGLWKRSWKYDLLLTPTTAQLPVPLNTIHQNQDIPIEEWHTGTSQFNAFTNLFKATGLPAISLPLCRTSTGLPVGIQFAAGFGKEDLLIRVAGAFEEPSPWADRKPPVHVGIPVNHSLSGAPAPIAPLKK